MSLLPDRPSENRPKLWIVSPVYFDVESYLVLRRALESELEPTPFAQTTCFVAVDDSGGTDPRIRELTVLPHTEVIEPPFSLGHQRALVFGLRTLSGRIRDTDVVVTLDADGEDQPADLRRLIHPLMEEPQNLRKVSLALRTRRRESPFFRVLYFFFKLLFRLATGTVIRSGNYVAYRGWFARKLLFHPHFDLCYSSSVVSFQLAVQRIPCERGARYAGVSRMTYLKLIMHGIRMLMPFADRIAIRGLVAFSILLAAATGLGLWVIWVRLFTELAVPGWATSSLLLALVLCGTALTCVIMLFSLFVQTQSLSMSRLDIHLGDVHARDT